MFEALTIILAIASLALFSLYRKATKESVGLSNLLALSIADEEVHRMQRTTLSEFASGIEGQSDLQSSWLVTSHLTNIAVQQMNKPGFVQTVSTALADLTSGRSAEPLTGPSTPAEQATASLLAMVLADSRICQAQISQFRKHVMSVPGDDKELLTKSSLKFLCELAVRLQKSRFFADKLPLTLWGFSSGH